MKRVFIVFLTLCLLFTTGCSSLAFRRISNILSDFTHSESTPTVVPSDQTKDDTPKPTKPTPTLVSPQPTEKTLPDIDIYLSLKNKVSLESYQALLNIYNTYGIEIKFSDSVSFDSVVAKKLSLEDYDQAILKIDQGLSALGDHPQTIKIIDNYIDTIFCFGSLKNQRPNIGYLVDDGKNAIFLNMRYKTKDARYYTAALMSSVASCIGKAYNLKSYGFTGHQYYGFIDYDKALDNPEDAYLNILEKNHIVATDDITTELWRAGFFSKASLISASQDFSIYVRELILSDSALWGFYPYLEPMHSKADGAIALLSEINPAWTRDYFIKLSGPDNTTKILDPDNLMYSHVALLMDKYQTTYQDDSGDMIGTLNIYSADNDMGTLKATFSFAPAEGNTKGKSGMFDMTGGINLRTSAFTLSGTKWISEPQEGYDLFVLKGNLFATSINATVQDDKGTEMIFRRTADE